MKILCYGDSNTWGYVPNINGYSKNATMHQYNEKDCWWYDLKKKNELLINGVCGRCIAHENRWLKNRNATETIDNELCQYENLDLIIVQLGTNDCKSEYNDSALQISKNLEILLNKINRITNAQIMLISPAIINENNKITQKYYIGAQKKSAELDKYYEQIAHNNGYIFISGIDLEVGEDGEHLTLAGHQQLKNKIHSKINYIQNLTGTEKLG